MRKKWFWKPSFNPQMKEGGPWKVWPWRMPQRNAVASLHWFGALHLHLDVPAFPWRKKKPPLRLFSFVRVDGDIWWWCSQTRQNVHWNSGPTSKVDSGLASQNRKWFLFYYIYMLLIFICLYNPFLQHPDRTSITIYPHRFSRKASTSLRQIFHSFNWCLCSRDSIIKSNLPSGYLT